MGDTQSTLAEFSLPAMDDSKDTFPCLYVREDTVDLLYANSKVQEAVNKAFANQRLIILREELKSTDWWSCQLRRRLFKKDGLFSDSENLELRGLRLNWLLCVLSGMDSAGYEPMVSFKLLRKSPNNYSSLAWQCKRHSEAMDFLCVDLIGMDRLAVVHPDPGVRQALLGLVETEARGLVRSTTDLINGTELRFSQELWSVRRVSGEGRFLLLRIFEFLREAGWSQATSLNLSEDDTLVFCKPLAISSQPALCTVPGSSQTKPAFILMSLEQHNQIRLISRDPAANAFIYEAIGSNWLNRGGVMLTSPGDNSMVIQMCGSPWRTHKYSDEAISTKWLFCDLFEKCWLRGWWPVASFDKSDNAKSIYVLEAGRPAKASVFAMALAGKWMIRVMHASRFVIDHIKETIHRKWYKEVYLEQVDDTCWLINLGGDPWAKEVIPGLTLIIQIMASLHKLGWRLFLSAKSSGIYETGKAFDDSCNQTKKFHQAEIDTLWFCKVELDPAKGSRTDTSEI